VRLAPLQNLKIKDVFIAIEEDDQTTLTIVGQHKTGKKCSVALPNELFYNLKCFCERLITEQGATNESPVQLHFKYI